MAGPQISVTGARQLTVLARQLKAAGDGALRRELLASIRKATAPAKTAIPESARRTLPRRGGLNEYVAKELTVTNRTSLSRVQARVRVTAFTTDGLDHDLKGLNRGKVRHPLFGDWRHVYGEAVPPGFFTNPMLDLAPLARRQIQLAIEKVLRQITT